MNKNKSDCFVHSSLAMTFRFCHCERSEAISNLLKYLYHKMFLLIIFITFSFIFIPIICYAQGDDEILPTFKKGETYEIHMTSDKFIYDDKKDIIKLIGNVVITQKDTTIKCPQAEYDTKKEIAKCTNGIEITQPDTIVTGDIMKAYYKEKKAIIVGNVKIVTEKKPEKIKNKKVKDEFAGSPITITSDRMTFYWEKNEVVAEGEVTIIQNDKKVFCDEAHYSKTSKLITLKGNVRFERKKGDWFTCNEALIELDKNTFTAQGDVEGNFLTTQEEKKVTETQKSELKCKFIGFGNYIKPAVVYYKKYGATIIEKILITGEVPTSVQNNDINIESDKGNNETKDDKTVETPPK